MRNLILLIFVALIVYFTYTIYYPEETSYQKLEREEITQGLTRPGGGSEPPHYKYIARPVSWYGTLMGYKKKSADTVILQLWVNQKASKRADTLLVTKISNIDEFYKQNKNKLLWFKGQVQRIDVDVPGQEIVYVNGFIFDGKFF